MARKITNYVHSHNHPQTNDPVYVHILRMNRDEFAMHVMCMFVWSDSTQGHDYWAQFVEDVDGAPPVLQALSRREFRRLRHQALKERKLLGY